MYNFLANLQLELEALQLEGLMIQQRRLKASTRSLNKICKISSSTSMFLSVGQLLLILVAWVWLTKWINDQHDFRSSYSQSSKRHGSNIGFLTKVRDYSAFTLFFQRCHWNQENLQSTAASTPRNPFLNDHWQLWGGDIHVHNNKRFKRSTTCQFIDMIWGCSEVSVKFSCRILQSESEQKESGQNPHFSYYPGPKTILHRWLESDLLVPSNNRWQCLIRLREGSTIYREYDTYNSVTQSIPVRVSSSQAYRKNDGITVLRLGI